MTVSVGVVYKFSQMVEKLQIKDSVFKKYIYELEEKGYVFEKNRQGHRLFYDEDIQALEMFIKMIQYDGVTIEMAAKKISEMNGYNGISDESKEQHDVMTLMSQLLEEQRTIYEKQAREQEKQFAIKTQEILEQKLEEQEKRVLAKINIQEHHNLLKQSIKELREVKQMIHTNQENKPFTFKGWIKSLWK